MDIAIFIPCFIDQFYPKTAVNMVQLLRKAGCRIHYTPQQTCCGQAAFNAGFVQESRAVAEKWLADFAPYNAMPIVCPSASCAGFLRNYLRQVTPNSANNLVDSVWELSEFLVKKAPARVHSSNFSGKVAYHHSCSALHECNNRNYALQLLAQVKGLILVDTPDADVCCGFGGTFAIKFEPISVAMAEKKVENAVNAGADYIVSTDSSCLMQLEGYIQNKNLLIKTLHIADVLNMEGTLMEVTK